MTCYIVLGMHRSGTTLLSKVMEELGVLMRNDLAGEDGVVRSINESLCGSWTKMTGCGDDVRAEQLERFRKHVQSHGKDTTTRWGFKDPRTCLTIRDLYPVLLEEDQEVKLLVTHRPRDAILASLQKRDKRGLADDERIHDTHLQERERFLSAVHLPILNVPYNYLVDHPEEVVADIAAFVKCGATKEIVAATKVVNPSLRHHDTRNRPPLEG